LSKRPLEGDTQHMLHTACCVGGGTRVTFAQLSTHNLPLESHGADAAGARDVPTGFPSCGSAPHRSQQDAVVDCRSRSAILADCAA
jgi:hypothetical protein